MHPALPQPREIPEVARRGALGVEDEVCELVCLTRRSREGPRNQQLHGHRRPDSPDEAAEMQEWSSKNYLKMQYFA